MPFPRCWYPSTNDAMSAHIHCKEAHLAIEIKRTDLALRPTAEMHALALAVCERLGRPDYKAKPSPHNRRVRFYIELWHRDEPGAHDHNVPQVSTEADLDNLTADAGSRLIAMMIAAALETGRDLAYQGRTPTGGAGMWKLVKGHLIEYLSNGRLPEDDPIRKLVVE